MTHRVSWLEGTAKTKRRSDADCILMLRARQMCAGSLTSGGWSIYDQEWIRSGPTIDPAKDFTYNMLQFFEISKND